MKAELKAKIILTVDELSAFKLAEVVLAVEQQMNAPEVMDLPDGQQSKGGCACLYKRAGEEEGIGLVFSNEDS